MRYLKLFFSVLEGYNGTLFAYGQVNITQFNLKLTNVVKCGFQNNFNISDWKWENIYNDWFSRIPSQRNYSSNNSIHFRTCRIGKKIHRSESIVNLLILNSPQMFSTVFTYRIWRSTMKWVTIC